MYVRGEFSGDITDLQDVIDDVQNFIAANPFVDLRCIFRALEYLREILDADIEE